jgi:hypothetical protein
MRRESSTWFKYIGLVLNLLAVGLVLGPMVFAIGMDLRR